MPREKEMYQDNLRRVMEKWPDQELIRFREVAKWLGVDFRSLQSDRTFPLKKISGRYYVAATALASWLS